MGLAQATAAPVRTAVPSFFDPANAGKYEYNPSIPTVFDEAMQARSNRSIKASALDKKKFQLLPIDMQKDFSHPEGTLYVGGRSGDGAIQDSRRVAEFIYRNLSVLTEIRPTFDTHVPFQIFSRSFWVKADSTPVDANTVISAEDVKRGTYVPSPTVALALGIRDYNWLVQYAIHYCEELERAGKYMLYIWPEHCMLGSAGHNLVGVIQEAIMFHAYARGSQNTPEIKGGNPLTENYSVLGPEVTTRQDGKPFMQKNVKFIETLLNADYVAICGQASSHCVASSIDDLLKEILAKDPALARKVYVMEDCMSAVAIPDGKGGFVADFTPQAEAALERFRNAGMHIVKSTDSLDTWPDLVL